MAVRGRAPSDGRVHRIMSWSYVRRDVLFGLPVRNERRQRCPILPKRTKKCGKRNKLRGFSAIRGAKMRIRGVKFAFTGAIPPVRLGVFGGFIHPFLPKKSIGRFGEQAIGRRRGSQLACTVGADASARRTADRAAARFAPFLSPPATVMRSRCVLTAAAAAASVRRNDGCPPKGGFFLLRADPPSARAPSRRRFASIAPCLRGLQRVSLPFLCGHVVGSVRKPYSCRVKIPPVRAVVPKNKAADPKTSPPPGFPSFSASPPCGSSSELPS